PARLARRAVRVAPPPRPAKGPQGAAHRAAPVLRHLRLPNALRIAMSYRLRNFVIAGVLALLAGILTTTYVSHYKHKVQTGAGLVPVLVATKDASAGTPGKKIHSILEKVEERSLVAGAVANPSKLGGLVSQAPIYAGEQITTRPFAP